MIDGPSRSRLRPAPLAAAASVTMRADPSCNQDAVIVLSDADGCCGVVVADGVGCWERSGYAAIAAAEAAATSLRVQGPVAIQEAFDAAHQAVVALADDGPAGTTLLIATVPVPGEVVIAHVGNGAFLLVSDGNKPAAGVCRPRWTNHLIPHIGIEAGREVLLRVLSTELADQPAPIPSMAWLAPTTPAALAVVTDGLWSDEQASIGVTSDGMTWLHQTPVLTRTLQAVARLLETADAGPSAANSTLVEHLEQLRAAHLLEDDATDIVILP